MKRSTFQIFTHVQTTKAVAKSRPRPRKNQDTKCGFRTVKTQQNYPVILDENNGLNKKQRGMFEHGK